MDTLTSCWLCLEEAGRRGEDKRALDLGEEEESRGGETELGLKEEKVGLKEKVGEEGEREGLEEEGGRGGEVMTLDFAEEGKEEGEGEREGLEEEEGRGGACTLVSCIGGLIITLEKPTEEDSCGWEGARGGDAPVCLEITGMLLVPVASGKMGCSAGLN